MVRLQSTIDPQRKQFQPGKGVGAVMTDVDNNPMVLPTQFIAGTLVGMQEVVAGLLWVRTDEFFHTGNYEAVLPMVRMITWLDPHQVDVYSTGAWHMDYNFVDSSQRADRRYLMPAIKFMEEGIQNNPAIYDLYSDLGFTHYYLKAQNFDKSVYWFKEAAKHNPPYYVYHEIAHSYEKQGKIDEAIKAWENGIKIGQAALAKNPKDITARMHIDVSKRNLDGLRIRRIQRASLRPVDMNFHAEFKKIGPRVFEVSGTANLPNQSRIDVTLLDQNYKDPNFKSFTWEVDPNATALVDIGVHGISVMNGKFKRRYDISKDAKQYPFKKDKYVLTMQFNPLMGSNGVQDKTGWHGEGITDKQYLDTSTIPGTRMITKTIVLKKSDIL